jgi:hypothetical protein
MSEKNEMVKAGFVPTPSLESSNGSNFKGRSKKWSSELFFDYFGLCLSEFFLTICCLVIVQWHKMA